MANKIIGGDAPFTAGSAIGVGLLGVSAAFQPLNGLIESIDIITEEINIRSQENLAGASPVSLYAVPLAHWRGFYWVAERKKFVLQYN